VGQIADALEDADDHARRRRRRGGAKERGVAGTRLETAGHAEDPHHRPLGPGARRGKPERTATPRARLIGPERTAQRNVRVAHFASAEQEQTFGVSKLDAVLGYLEAKNGAPLDRKIPIAFERIKIPVKTAGGLIHKHLGAASVPEVRAAARLVSKKGPKIKQSETARAVGDELGRAEALSAVVTTEHGELCPSRTCRPSRSPSSRRP
jgi:hypothetical protein